ncbi:type II secretion system F family protein [Aeoliella mucimassa]|uniref:Type II secretion system protein F n=1 Tax=Aeoliella mucimassa TaxID=2527972 RepID=A0A518AH53_9BACT|nr:type II secretion system F family protein [Aeoliella mucimassa]QDU54060.1 Type II secretion system protein F [Aeoliella mucimassa]
MDNDPANSNVRSSTSATASDARLPFGVVLEALADDLGDAKVRRAVNQMLPELKAGQPVEQVIAKHERKLPPYLVGLLRTATDGERLTETCDALVQLREARLHTWRVMAGMLMYPLLLVLAFVGLACLMSWAIVPPMASLMNEFDLELPVTSEWFFGTAYLIPWVTIAFAGLFALVLVGPRLFGVGYALRNTLPVLGQLYVCLSHEQFAVTLANFVRLKIPMPEALRYTADLLDDGSLSRASRRAADRVERGASLAESISISRQFARSLTTMVAWGETSSSFDESLMLAAEMFADHRFQRVQLLRRIVPPLTLVAVASLTLSAVASMVMPLVKLIEGLS